MSLLCEVFLPICSLQLETTSDECMLTAIQNFLCKIDLNGDGHVKISSVLKVIKK